VPNPNPDPAFPQTRWSVVALAADGDQEVSKEGLERLCRIYWYPLYAFARRSGQSAPDAEDLTQGFFHALVLKDWLAAVDRNKGRLRTFLLTAFRRYMAKEWRRNAAEIRGGSVTLVPLDSLEAEHRYAEATPDLSAAGLFDRQWTLVLMERTFDSLKEEFEKAGKGVEFGKLKGTLMAGPGAIDYPEMARGLGMSEGAVRVAVHRMRKRFRTRFREAVERTLDEGEDVEGELRYLASTLGELGN
jgi:DNA-directed RNA polymerase specialized sigma24 family protein